QARTFRTQRAAVDRVIGVALDVHDAGLDVLRLVTDAVHDQAATDRAVRTGVASLGGARQLELTRLRQRFRRREAERNQTRAHQAGRGYTEKLPSVHVHLITSFDVSGERMT